MRFRTALILGCSLVLVVCVAAMLIMVVSGEALARVVVGAPGVVARDFAASDHTAAVVVETADGPALGADEPAVPSTMTVHRVRQLSEAELDARDREADRLAGVENGDPPYRHRSAPLASDGIALPVGGISMIRREAPVTQAAQASEPIEETPQLPDEATEQPLPTDVFGYYGAFPAVPTVNAPAPSPGVQPYQTVPYQTVPYQTQPTPGVMRGY